MRFTRYVPPATRYEYDRRQKNKRKKVEKARRRAKRLERSINYPVWIEPKYGCRPMSILHPRHPARLYGWDDPRTRDRDRTRWE